MHTYIITERNPTLYTVGFYTPKGKWNPIDDFSDEQEARDLVNYLNGRQSTSQPTEDK